LLVILVLGACTSPDQAAEKAAPRVSDTAFEVAATQVCSQTVQIFDTATSLPKDPSRDQSANFLENVAATFQTMVSQLHALAVNAPNQPAVNAWLSDWDAYVAFGHTYAEAVRTGHDGALVQSDSARVGAIRRRIRAFAAVNHMRKCRFP
jgi:hypothetical protein